MRRKGASRAPLSSHGVGALELPGRVNFLISVRSRAGRPKPAPAPVDLAALTRHRHSATA
jgi:hypothetical protein